MAEKIYKDTDNLVQVTGLKDAETDAYINDATIVMSLYQKQAEKKVQVLLPNAPATLGTWTLTYKGQTTSALTYNASLWAIQEELDALSAITAGDMEVGGDTLDTDPVVGGMTFTWAETFADVSELSFDFSSLTGPTQASSSMTKKTKNLIQGPAVDKGGGLVGIPVINHDAATGDKVRFEGTENYDKEYTVDATSSTNEIVITETYAAETFSGDEILYIGMANGTAISLSYVAESEGNYNGILPDTVKGLVLYERVETSKGSYLVGVYHLFVTTTKDTSKRTDRLECRVYYGSEQ